MSRGRALVLSCEHGGHRVPGEYARLFAGARAVLRSHRGWDRGALALAGGLADALDASLFDATVTRLLVDLNRAETNPAVFSTFSRQLGRAERQRLLDAHHRPHREAIRRTVGEHIARRRQVLHVAVHSFTPALDGVVRTTDVGLLYDPARTEERARAVAWKHELKQRLPRLTVHCNAPYRGTSDGLTRWLRTHFSSADYLGIELEVNQRFVGDRAWSKLRGGVIESLGALLG